MLYVIIVGSLLICLLHALISLTQKERKLNGHPTVFKALCSFMFLKGPTSRECWYLDFGCSDHMTRNISHLALLIKVNGDGLTFENNGQIRFVKNIQPETLSFV